MAGAIFFATRGAPNPSIHDEFSYLLAADTFSHARLTNPAHPLWIFFESFRINQQPTYASMYPPGQGLAMAVGTLLFGDPWFGVWASVVVLSLVSVWALRGWFPAEWAFIGALLTATIGCWSYWLSSYWGGAIAATGGALILGAWPRLERRPAVRESVLFGLGAAILANTRPYEGGVMTLIAVLSLFRSAKMRPVAPMRVYLRQALSPAGLVMVATLCWMMFYWWRVTGNALLSPYVLNMRTYSYHQPFVWQSDRPVPVYHHELMRRFHAIRRDRWDVRGTWAMIRANTNHYMGWLLLLPFLGLPWIIRSARIRGMFIATAGVGIALLPSIWIRPHYLAPATVGIVGLTVQAFRYLTAMRVGGRRVGLLAAYSIIFLWLGFHWVDGMVGLIRFGPIHDWATARAEVQKNLAENGVQNLVVVRYDENHDPNHEWVYNGADLENAPVLWVREMKPEENRALFSFFKGRWVWLLEADRGRLTRYPLP